MQTPLIANKRKAAEALQKSEFEMPVAPGAASKRAKHQKASEIVQAVAATPLRDQMRLNQEQAQYSEAWEKSSIASGYTSTLGRVVDIKTSLSALPAPQNSDKENAEMADEQIARLEADVEMHEAREKGEADRERARIDEEERQERLREEEA